jgi:predicted nuclease with TOPRIM domain
MNKTLLLILCDFLLLTLLALTRWESAEPIRPTQPTQSIPDVGVQATREHDLVETMRLSLQDERAAREELAQRLSSVDATLAAREQSLTEIQAERARLAEERNAVAQTLTQTQRAAAELNQRVNAVTQEATMTKEQLAQLQRELSDREAEAERQRAELARLEKQHVEARRHIEGLTLAVVVAEQEKKNLRETAETLKTQVEVERAERVKVQEATTQLVQGVGQLAEKSTELSRELRDNRPINANVLYNEFLANRVTAAFNANRRGLLGQVNRSKETATVLVTDGMMTYALLHIADTVFSYGENAADWDALSIELSRGFGRRVAGRELQFMVQDPRIVAIPVAAAQVQTLGATAYSLAADPFKFPEAVLIDGGGRGYGEVGFKLDPSDPNFVRVDNRLFRRLAGDFSPKRGDLVFSKTGELLGIMVNNDYCAVIRNFVALRSMRTGGNIRAQSTSGTIEDLAARSRALPLKLQ